MVQLTINQRVDQLDQKYKVLSVVDLDQCPEDYEQAKEWIDKKVKELYKPEYTADEQIGRAHV